MSSPKWVKVHAPSRKLKVMRGLVLYKRCHCVRLFHFHVVSDPMYVLENDVPIDVEYYLSNQLEGPLTRIFEPILGPAVSRLFSGDHTRSVKILAPAAQPGGIMKFAVKTRTCIGCKVPLSGNQKVVCNHCQMNQAQLYIKQLNNVRAYEQSYSELWTQCQRCQGSLHQEILCASRDCPIFYRRVKVQKDLKRAQDKLDQFTF
jgi:DNA polymerase delta subunit 1